MVSVGEGSDGSVWQKLLRFPSIQLEAGSLGFVSDDNEADNPELDKGLPNFESTTSARLMIRSPFS